jgi:molybdate transport system substrate-binding protein
VHVRRIVITLVTAGVAASAVAGCGSSATPGNSASPGTSGSAPAALSGSITVFAAASLQEAFTTIGKQFEAAHPGVHVTFSFGASSTLAQQIVSGAPADVFASAAPKNMRQVVTAGDASHPVNFARNVMEVAVPLSNPAHVTSVNDLAKPAVKVALCQPQVPCGATAATVFSNAKITVKPVTLQPDVKSVLTQVELGNVDAGMVYATDVNAAGKKVAGVRIPSGIEASTEYPIATVSKSANAATAQAFVAYVLSAAGQNVLAAAKFGKP